jgi:hypothetical protein
MEEGKKMEPLKYPPCSTCTVANYILAGAVLLVAASYIVRLLGTHSRVDELENLIK